MDCLKRLAILSTFALSAGSQAAVFHYDNFALDSERWVLPDSLVVNTEHLWLLAGDEEHSLTLCQGSQPLTCFTSGPLSFAVPNSPIDLTSEWAINGSSYKVASESTIEIMGVKTAAFRIRSASKSVERTEFLYSNELGLVAIDLFSKGSTRVTHYTLREPLGFGASRPNNSFKPNPLRSSRHPCGSLGGSA